MKKVVLLILCASFWCFPSHAANSLNAADRNFIKESQAVYWHNIIQNSRRLNGMLDYWLSQNQLENNLRAFTANLEMLSRLTQGAIARMSDIPEDDVNEVNQVSRGLEILALNNIMSRIRHIRVHLNLNHRINTLQRRFIELSELYRQQNSGLSQWHSVISQLRSLGIQVQSLLLAVQATPGVYQTARLEWAALVYLLEMINVLVEQPHLVCHVYVVENGVLRELSSEEIVALRQQGPLTHHPVVTAPIPEIPLSPIPSGSGLTYLHESNHRIERK